VNSVEDLLDTAKALDVSPIPNAPRVAILSSQAGPGIAAADICQLNDLAMVPFK